MTVQSASLYGILKGEWWAMNRNWFETKRVWANTRHCSGIFQETTKNLPAGVGFEPETFRKQTGNTGQLKCDGTRAETRFRLSAKRMSPFKSAGASVQSTTGSRRVRISGSNAGYTMFRGSVKGAAYPLHSPVSPSLSQPLRHRVPSHFNWSLPPTSSTTSMLFYQTTGCCILEYSNVYVCILLNSRSYCCCCPWRSRCPGRSHSLR